MDERLYNKTIKCPVCGNSFDATKIKAKTAKVVSRDSDFCVYYEDINPIFYDVYVCEFCGYASLADKFDDISERDRAILRDQLAPKWTKRSFAGERTADSAIEAFKLALYNLQIRKAKDSELSKVCIRIAWLYRLKNDPRENDFLKFALRCYSEAYQREDLTSDKLDETTCMYMIAELNRRLGNIAEAARWFSRIMSSPEARKNAVILEKAREQYQLVKDASKEHGSA